MAGAVFGEHHLLQRAGAGVGLEREHAREHVPAGDDVADPQRRGDRLGKRADVDDAAALAHGVERRRAAAVPDQIRVAIVLEDRHAVAVGEFQQRAAARLAHDGAGRVLHGRNRVDIFRADAAALVVDKRGLERVEA